MDKSIVSAAWAGTLAVCVLEKILEIHRVFLRFFCGRTRERTPPTHRNSTDLSTLEDLLAHVEHAQDTQPAPSSITPTVLDTLLRTGQII